MRKYYFTVATNFTKFCNVPISFSLLNFFSLRITFHFSRALHWAPCQDE